MGLEQHESAGINKQLFNNDFLHSFLLFSFFNQLLVEELFVTYFSVYLIKLTQLTKSEQMNLVPLVIEMLDVPE